MSCRPTRSNYIVEFMRDVTVFVNIEGIDGGWNIRRFKSRVISARIEDTVMLCYFHSISDREEDFEIAVRLPPEWSIRIFLVLLCISIETCHYSLSCMKGDPYNDVSDIVSDFHHYPIEELTLIISSSIWYSCIRGGNL